MEGSTSREREAEEQAERERLRKQWLKEQERIRSKSLFLCTRLPCGLVYLLATPRVHRMKSLLWIPLWNGCRWDFGDHLQLLGRCRSSAGHSGIVPCSFSWPRAVVDKLMVKLCRSGSFYCVTVIAPHKSQFGILDCWWAAGSQGRFYCWVSACCSATTGRRVQGDTHRISWKSSLRQRGLDNPSCKMVMNRSYFEKDTFYALQDRMSVRIMKLPLSWNFINFVRFSFM